MLGEVGDARLIFTFVAGASAHEDDKAYRAAVGHGAGDNPQAIIEHSLVIHNNEFYFAFMLSVNEALLPPYWGSSWENAINAKPSLSYRAGFYVKSLG